MIDVTNKWVPALVVAIVCGIIGGFASELLITRKNGQTGMVELPGGRLGKRLFDLGFLSSIILGAIAAPVFLLAYKPTETTVITSGVSVTTDKYSMLGLIAVSLAVGAAGASILGAFAKAFTKAAEAAKLDSILTGLKDVQAHIVTRTPAIDGTGGPGEAAQLSGKVGVLIAQTEQMLTE